MKTVLTESARNFFASNPGAEVAFNNDLNRQMFASRVGAVSFLLYKGNVLDAASCVKVASIKKSLQEKWAAGEQPAVCFTEVIDQSGEVVSYLLRDKQASNLEGAIAF